MRTRIWGIPVLGTLDSKTGAVKMQPLPVACDGCGRMTGGIKVDADGAFHSFCRKAYLGPKPRPYNVEAAARAMGIAPNIIQAHRDRGEHRCSTCREWYTAKWFSKNKSRPTGVSANCRFCLREKHKARKEKRENCRW